MRIWLRLWGQDMRMACCSIKFVLSVALIVLLSYTMTKVFIAFDLIDMYNLMYVGNSVHVMTICLIPSIPYALSYVVDVRNRMVLYEGARSGLTEYGISKFASAVLSGMLAYILASAVIIAIYALGGMPLWTYDAQNGYAYQALLGDTVQNSHPVAALSLTVLHHALTAGMFAGLAFGVSTIVPNIYVAMITPILLDSLYLRIYPFLHLPEWLGEIALVQDVYDMGSVAATFFTKFGCTFAILATVGAVSLRMIRRRFMNE